MISLIKLSDTAISDGVLYSVLSSDSLLLVLCTLYVTFLRVIIDYILKGYHWQSWEFGNLIDKCMEISSQYHDSQLLLQLTQYFFHITSIYSQYTSSTREVVKNKTFFWHSAHAPSLVE